MDSFPVPIISNIISQSMGVLYLVPQCPIVFFKKHALVSQEVVSVWANYASAMKRDFDPSSPFLEPNATSSAQKCAMKLSSMVQQSHASPQFIQLASPDGSSPRSDDEPRNTADVVEDGMCTPISKTRYMYTGPSSTRSSGDGPLRVSSPSSELKKGQQDEGGEVLVGSLPKRSLLPHAKVIDLRKHNAEAATSRGSR